MSAARSGDAIMTRHQYDDYQFDINLDGAIAETSAVAGRFAT